MELVLVHITDIHLENDTDYNILEGRSEYIANHAEGFDMNMS